MDFTPHIERLRRRFQELEERIAAPGFYDQPDKAQEVLREHKHLKAALDTHGQWEQTVRTIGDNLALIESGEDEELSALAREELPALEARRDALHQRVMTTLLPPDPNDSRNTILEIRAGTGGDEAALFAADLFRMYQRYAERNGWKMDIMDSSPSEGGGYREIIVGITGEDVYKGLRFESGVHRVQRVPATESQGRIHTSAASVAVLPEAREVDVEIKADDLQIDITRSGGPGGQGVNTTDSCVQITHKPSGIIVRCQDGRSQIKNKEKALNILRSRLLEQKQAEERAQYAAQRKQQIGSGDRNEKIRTYNFPQSRVTDHRIHFTTHNIDGVMDGDLEEMVFKLQAEDVLVKLNDLNAKPS